jgi:DNA-binding XRE family transcriptional regulator
MCKLARHCDYYVRVPYLKQARERAKLTQQQLAEKANVGRSTIIKLESGEATPQQETARRLADALKLATHQLRFASESRIKGDEPKVNGKSTVPRGSDFEVHPDGTVTIWLDLFMSKKVQLALFGKTWDHLSSPGALTTRRDGTRWTAQNMLHLRGLPNAALKRLAEADDAPVITAVTSHGLVLACEANNVPDGFYEDSVHLLYVPWSVVVAVDSGGSLNVPNAWTGTVPNDESGSDDGAE